MRRTLLAIFMVMLIVCSTAAQPVLTPRNVALGGGGSTYITDYNANFYNPANLMIQDRERSIDAGLFIAGTYFNAVRNFTNLNDQRNNLRDYIYSYSPGAYTITSPERNQLIEDNYIRNRSLSRHQTRFDITLLGFKWRNKDKAYSIALRNRISSSFEVGRGWYSTVPQELDGINTVDRTLNHRYQSLYELSFGYAENFRFFTDMTPRLDEFTFGIAPKFVIAGAYQSASWKNIYQEETDGGISQINNFDFLSTGSFGRATSEYLAGSTAEQALSNNINDRLFNPYGYGAGIDIGFTYLITLGNDLSTIENVESRTQKSLRLSFSITDLGFVYYDNNNASISSGIDTPSVMNFPGTDDIAMDSFVGAPGQFLAFTDQFGISNPFITSSRSDGSLSVLLPTSIHAGALFEINRIKIMGDLSIGLTDNAFNSKKLLASVGLEVRPLKFLPLRAGTQLANELPSFFSFGTAIETKMWDLSVATQFVSRTFNENPTLTGVTVAAFQFHF